MNYIVLQPTKDANSAMGDKPPACANAQDLHPAEERANTTKFPSVLKSIPVGLRDVVFENALEIKQLAKAIVEQALQMGQRLWRMNSDLKCKEYGVFLRVLGWTTTKARKYINLAKTFDGFEITQLTGIELTTLLSLCSSRYQKVVAQLREIPEISQELVEQLMKSVRVVAPKQDRISGWKRCRSGGGRYYNVLLHDERTGLLIEEQAEAQGVLPQKVIADAVALLAQHDASEIQPDEYALAQIEEFKQEVGMRSLSELELLVQAADACNVAAKTWTIEERQFLSKSLSDYLRKEPEALNQVSWVSKNLLEEALANLSFTLKKMGGPDNLASETTREYVHGCCFVSLQNFGTKYEQWLFQKDEKLFPVFGRDEFMIEKFNQQENEVLKTNSTVGT